MIRNEGGDLQANPAKFISTNFLMYTTQNKRRNLTFLPQNRERSETEVEMPINKLRNIKSPGIDNTTAELIKACGTTLIKELHKSINAIWRKEELPKEWKTSIAVPVYKKGDKSDCNNYRGISLLSTCYKVLSK